MARKLPSCFFVQFLEQLPKFLVNFTLLKYVISQRSCGFLITKELTFGFQILDLKDHFSASLKQIIYSNLRFLCSCPQEGAILLITQNFDPAKNWMDKMQLSEIFTAKRCPS